MVYRVELSNAALKSLKNIPKKELERIGKKIDFLEKEPRPANVEKLSGYDNLYRVRSGDYRVVYRIFDARLFILVIDIGHRREIYRDL